MKERSDFNLEETATRVATALDRHRFAWVSSPPGGLNNKVAELVANRAPHSVIECNLTSLTDALNASRNSNPSDLLVYLNAPDSWENELRRLSTERPVLASGFSPQNGREWIPLQPSAIPELDGVAFLSERALAKRVLYDDAEIVEKWRSDPSFLQFDQLRPLIVSAFENFSQSEQTAIRRLRTIEAPVDLAILEYVCGELNVAPEKLIQWGWVRKVGDQFSLVRPYRAALDRDLTFSSSATTIFVSIADRFTHDLAKEREANFARFFLNREAIEWAYRASDTPSKRTIDRAYAALSEIVRVPIETSRLETWVDSEPSSLPWRLAVVRQKFADGKNRLAQDLLAETVSLASTPEEIARCQIVVAADVASRDPQLAQDKLDAVLQTLVPRSKLAALVRVRLGYVALQTYRLNDAHTHFIEGLKVLRQTAHPIWHIDVMTGLGFTHTRRDELAIADRYFDETVNVLRSSGDRSRLAMALFNRGTTATVLKKPDAIDAFRQALDLWVEQKMERYFSTTYLQIGVSKLMSGADASMELAEAVKWGHWSSDANSVAIAQGLLAAVEQGKRSDEAILATLMESSERISAVHFPVEFAFFRHAIAKLSNQKPVLGIDVEDADLFVNGALRALTDETSSSSHPYVFLYRSLFGSVARKTEATNMLAVAPESKKFRVGDNEIVDISRRKPLRKILAQMVDAHGKSVEYGFSVDDLISIGWPGEKIDRKSGANRVYTAIRFLRASGLENCLVKSHLGYRIAPEFNVVKDVKL